MYDVGVKLPRNIVNVPVTHQTSDYSCGAAVVTALLRYFGIAVDAEREMRAMLKTSKSSGTAMESMAQVLRGHGLRVKIVNNDSLRNVADNISAGSLPVLAIQAWPDSKKPSDVFHKCNNGHYVVVVGSDPQNVYFMDPNIRNGNYGYIPRAELLRRWRDTDRHKRCVNRQSLWVSGHVTRPSQALRGVSKID